MNYANKKSGQEIARFLWDVLDCRFASFLPSMKSKFLSFIKLHYYSSLSIGISLKWPHISGDYLRPFSNPTTFAAQSPKTDCKTVKYKLTKVLLND